MVRTDHSALRWLFNFKNPENQVARWLEVLNTYDSDIVHRPGKQHGNADGVSRIPCKQCGYGSSNLTILADHEVNGPVRVNPSVNVVGKSYTIWDNWDVDFLRQQQTADVNLQPIIDWLEDGVRPGWEEVSLLAVDVKKLWGHWKLLRLIDGVLYRKYEIENSKESKMLVVPSSLRANVLNNLHNTPTAGHLGINKVLPKVKERFYWPSIKQDVEDWCRSCDTCATCKSSNKLRKARMKTSCW